jgi:exosortase K
MVPFKDRAAAHDRLAKVMLYLLVLAVATGLKLHYSRAASDDLIWILRPTAALTELISGIPFAPEAGTGYLSRAAHAIIAPACAGINFLIIVFGLTAATGISRLTGNGLRLGWICGALAGAYLVTIGVNALRIVVSINLYGADIYHGIVTPGAVHRAAGVCIYFACLLACHQVSFRILAGLQPQGFPRPARLCNRNMAPLLWYGAVTLGVPLLRHRQLAGDARFQQHFLTVLMVCAVVFIIFLIGQVCYQYLKRLFRTRKVDSL